MLTSNKVIGGVAMLGGVVLVWWGFKQFRG
jgi:hypothetical protein